MSTNRKPRNDKKFSHLVVQATCILLIGFVLGIFFTGMSTVSAGTTPRRAVITSIEGAVLVQTAGQAIALPARRNMEIKTGDRIITGHDGGAELRYDDGSTSRVGPGSRVDITNLSRQGTDGTETTVLSAQRGSVWNNAREVIRRNSRFEVNTPAASAGVRGTNFLVRVQPAGETLVRVYQGLVEINPAPPLPETPVLEEDAPPPPPGSGMAVSPFQQASIKPDQPLPPAPDPLDLEDVDDFELTNLSKDNPDVFIQLVEQAAEQGMTNFLQQVKELIETNESVQQQLGDQLEPIQQTIGTPDPPAAEPGPGPDPSPEPGSTLPPAPVPDPDPSPAPDPGDPDDPVKPTPDPGDPDDPAEPAPDPGPDPSPEPDPEPTDPDPEEPEEPEPAPAPDPIPDPEPDPDLRPRPRP